MFYLDKPVNFSPSLEAVGAFIEWKNKILLLHRCKENDIYQKLWGLPSGKMEKEDMDNPLVAILRETREETGYVFNPSEVSHIKTVFVRYPEKDFSYHIFRAQLSWPIEIKLSPPEHDGYLWVPPKKALNLSLIPGLEECISLVYSAADI